MSQACPVNAAFGSSTVTVDFTKGANDLFTASTGGTAVTYDPSLGAVFPIAKEGDSPTFTSTKYLFFGRVDVTMRVSTGTGIVSTFVLESDVLDEVDWEWLGGAPAVGQSNYFSKGDTATYGKLEQDIAVPGGDGEGTFHTYSIDWTPERLQWLVDGVSYRTLNYADSPSTYPQTPMQVKFGTWCGGCSPQQGTRDWAGGPPNWAQAPFNAYYKSIVIKDNSNGVANAVSYQYGDQTGNYKSIIVNTGSGATTGGSTGNAGSGSGSGASAGTSAATNRGVVTSTQGAPTTLSTATASASNGSSAVTTSGSAPLATAAGIAGAANGTVTSGGGSSKASSTGSGTASKTSSPVTAGASKSAVNLAFLGAALFAFVSL